MKRTFLLSATVAAAALVAGQAWAQQAPIATYNTDVFQYWHLNGEAWDNLPPPAGRARDGQVCS